MVICPHNFSAGAHGLMVVFLKHLLAMAAAGFCSRVHTVPWTFIPSKAGPCLLCAPTDSLAHVCLSALCNRFVRVVRVHVFRVQWLPQMLLWLHGGQSLHISLAFSHMAQNEEVDAFFPVLGNNLLQTLHWGHSRRMFKMRLFWLTFLDGSLMFTLSFLTSVYFKVCVLSYCCFISYRYFLIPSGLFSVHCSPPAVCPGSTPYFSCTKLHQKLVTD